MPQARAVGVVAGTTFRQSPATSLDPVKCHSCRRPRLALINVPTTSVVRSRQCPEIYLPMTIEGEWRSELFGGTPRLINLVRRW